jgi:hypothetical protein
VIVPPRQPPQGADLQRHQRPGAEQAGHHERQLDAVEPEPPAPPVHRPDRDQHGRRGHDQAQADPGLAGQRLQAAAGRRPEHGRPRDHPQQGGTCGQGPTRPAAGPSRRRPLGPGGRAQAGREARDRQHRQPPDPQIRRPSRDTRGGQPMTEHEEAHRQAAQGEQDQTAVTAAPGRHRGRHGHRQRAGRDGADHHQMGGHRPEDDIEPGLGPQQQQGSLGHQQGQQHDRGPSPGPPRLAANLVHISPDRQATAVT